jgi:hypothetical protein
MNVELRGRFWTALKGAAKYTEAIARGDVADDSARTERHATCAECPHKVRHRAMGRYIWTCGPFAQDRTSDTIAPTCGCIVMAQCGDAPEDLAGDPTRAEAAGKAVVASESCPQRRWERSDDAHDFDAG